MLYLYVFVFPPTPPNKYISVPTDTALPFVKLYGILANCVYVLLVVLYLYVFVFPPTPPNKYISVPTDTALP